MGRCKAKVAELKDTAAATPQRKTEGRGLKMNSPCLSSGHLTRTSHRLENIFQTHRSDRGLLSKADNDLLRLGNKKASHPIKNGQKTEQKLHQRGDMISQMKHTKRCSTSLAIREMPNTSTGCCSHTRDGCDHGTARPRARGMTTDEHATCLRDDHRMGMPRARHRTEKQGSEAAGGGAKWWHWNCFRMPLGSFYKHQAYAHLRPGRHTLSYFMESTRFY